MVNLPLVPKLRLACPYCYGIFPEWQIEFRCSGRPGTNGKRCEPQPDPRLENYFGITGDRPHTFRDNRHRYRSVCRNSGAETTTRVCPRCHSTLPVHFGRIHGQLIALVGARDSGKTVFMTVFMHEFGYRLGDRLGASDTGCRRRDPQQLPARLRAAAIRGPSLPDPTFTVAAERQGYRPPMVFKFKRQVRSRFPGRTRQTLLSFFDTAGEDLTTKASVRTQRPLPGGGRRHHLDPGSAADGGRPAAGGQRGAAAGSAAGGRSVQRPAADHRDAAGRPP